MAVSATTSPLAGLSRRLVQDGIIDEETVLTAVKAARKMKIGLVPYLVTEIKADPRQIAIAASHEFGVPLMDIEVLDRVDAAPGLELDLIDRGKISRVRYAEEQAFAAHHERQRLVLADQFLID